jgi:hypothetical protein
VSVESISKMLSVVSAGEREKAQKSDRVEVRDHSTDQKTLEWRVQGRAERRAKKITAGELEGKAAMEAETRQH